MIPLVDLQLKHMVVVLNCFVLLGALILQDLQLILKNFYSFFQLSKILWGILDKINVFVSCRFDLFIESLEMFQFVAGLLVFLGQVQDQKFLDFQLLSGLSHFSSRGWSFSGHGFSSSCGIFDFFLKIIDNFLEICQVLFKFSNFSFDLFLFVFVVGSFDLHSFRLLMDNSCIFLDLFLPTLLLSHFWS